MPELREPGDPSPPEIPTWWADVEAFIVIGSRPNNVPSSHEAVAGERPNRAMVLYHPGEALPEGLVTAAVWRGHGDRLAALDATGERLDRPARAEQAGEIVSESALKEWRTEHGLDPGLGENRLRV